MRLVPLFTLAFLTVTCAALAEERAPKPVVCRDFRVVAAKEGNLGICYDGKRPALWRTWGFVEVTDPDGAKVRVAVGFR